MDMQDKEFDKLFSSKLDDYEVQPSKAVWQGINEELGGNSRKKLIPYLSVAASISVLFAAGALFIPRTVKPVKQLAKTGIAKVNHTAIENATTKKAVNQVAAQTVNNTARQVAVLHQAKQRNTVTPSTIVAAIKKNAPAVKQDQQPVLVDANPHKSDVIAQQQTIVDTVNTLADMPVIHTPAKPVTLAGNLPNNVKPIDAQPVKRHHMKSFGDVMNVVIAAVDKRKDKVIEFSNTDDDESTITGVNLGFIKIKKQN